MKRIAVVGAGRMARVRARALLAAGEAEICAVASRHIATARELGMEMGCERCYDDYRELAAAAPDAVLVEVPHAVQDEIVVWALESGFHALVGGCLASTSEAAERISRLAHAKGLVVEAGYQARYSALWERARDLVAGGALGRLAAVRSIALWPADPATWYYRQEASGGMPLTHMTYCFVNPVRWIVGKPVRVSAFANRVSQTDPEMVREETCIASVLFEGDVLYSLTAGYVKPAGLPAWSAAFIGTDGAIELAPSQPDSQALKVYGGAEAQHQALADGRDPFEVQAEAFLAALDGPDECRNAPADAIWDIRVAEAIVTSARLGRTVDV